MPRRGDCCSGNARLFVGHLSSWTCYRDLKYIFGRYGRIRHVHLRRDYAFIEYRNDRDADDARHHLDGKLVDGRRITVEFAKGVPRAAGGVRESAGRGPKPGSGRCFNCGQEGHWARDCTAGDCKDKCSLCGKRGHIGKYCENSPKNRRCERSYSRSPRRGRSRSRSFNESPSNRSSAHKRGGDDVVYDERRSLSPNGVTKRRARAPPSKSVERSSTPVRERGRREDETGGDGYSNNPQEGPSSRKGNGERWL